MLRKWICLAWAVGLILGSGVEAKAGSGSIRIEPMWCGAPVCGVTVGVCKVGAKTEAGVVLTDGLADWQVQEDELTDGNWVNWLAQKEIPDERHCLAGNGGALFQNLQEGIYLVRQTDDPINGRLFEPFFLGIPDGENWDVYRAPKMISRGEPPKTGDRPTPLIGAMGIGISVAFLMVFVDEHRR